MARMNELSYRNGKFKIDHPTFYKDFGKVAEIRNWILFLPAILLYQE
jgi:hypothetical protein